MVDKDHARQWQNILLDEVLQAIARSPILVETLIFKGARILAQLLPEAARQSLDLDANCTREFLDRYADQAARAAALQHHLAEALREHFEDASPVNRDLEEVRVTPKPATGHPLGWNAFDVRIRVRDLTRASQRSLPALQLDIVAPEDLGPTAVIRLPVAGGAVRAYSLSRIAGEKLRAFLQSLPDHRAKLQRPGEAVRTKDLHDLAKIVIARPVTDTAFWREAGGEFRRACLSRHVDCAGWETVARYEALIRSSYVADRVLPIETPFPVAWEALSSIFEFLQASQLLPVVVPPQDSMADPD